VDYLYCFILRPLLFLTPPEFIHDLFISLGEWLGRYNLTRSLVAYFYNYKGPTARLEVDGLVYKTGVVLAAGFDYNGRLLNILPSLGFGGVEVGSVTARPCAGNPKPRLKRLPKLKSIWVNKGLRNDGVEVVAKRLAKYKHQNNFVVGVSIARTNDKDSVGVEAGIADYLFSLKTLVAAGVGDYYTINISCPNVFGGEAFAEPELLDQLLAKLKTVVHPEPMYVKMPINLSWDQFELLLKIVIKHQFNGVVIGNLNKSKEYLGNLSGGPCLPLALSLVEQTVQQYGNKLTVIACGGIFGPIEARAYLKAGAKLTQLITGMIYEGPGLIKKVAQVYGN